MRPAFTGLALSLSLALAHAADQLPAPPSPALTLMQAIALSDRLNETRDIAAARLQHALALRRQAIAVLLPSLSASAALQKSSISHRPFAANVSERDGAQVDVDLTLFNASSIDAVRSASASLSAQELDSQDLHRALAFQVASGFVNVIAVERQLQAAERRREVAAQTALQTRERVKAGVATGNDATRSDLELASAELTVTNDRQAVLAARLSLGDLVGRLVEEPLAEPPLADLPSRDLGELETLALRTRLDLRSSALRIRAIELQAQGTRFGLLPTVGLRGTYALSHDDPASIVTSSPQWQVGVVASWDLYNGGYREAAANALDADRREAAAVLRSNQRGLHRDLATALGALQTAEIAVVQAESQLKVALINAQEVQARFRQGLATALSAADANASVFQAESDLSGRQLDLQSSRFALRELIGRWPQMDADPSASASRTVP